MWLWRSERRPAKSLFAVYESHRNPDLQWVVTALLSLYFANCTVRILELCDSLILSLDLPSLPDSYPAFRHLPSFVMTFTNNAG